MSLDYMKSIFGSLREDLAAEHDLSLQKRLAELEEESVHFFGGQYPNRDDAIKVVLVRLIKEAIQSKNVQLCLTALNRLDPTNPINLINLDSTSPIKTVKMVANYFQIDDQEPTQGEEDAETLSRSVLTPKVHKQRKPVGDSDGTGGKDSPNQLQHLEEAKTNEIEENFSGALESYELSGARNANLLRVSIKHLMCAPTEFLHKYCLEVRELRSIWFNYLMECKRVEEAVAFCESAKDDTTCLLLEISRQQKANKLNDLLPNEIREFALAGGSKWNSVKQLDNLVSIGSRQNDAKNLLAELALQHLKLDNLELALTIAVSLGRADTVLDPYLAHFAHRSIDLNLVSTRESFYFENVHLLHHLSNSICRDLTPKLDIIRAICIHLGLLDEYLQIFSECDHTNEPGSNRLIEHLESAIESGSLEKRDVIDPDLKEATLNAVLYTIRRDEAREVNIQMVTIIILTIDVFLAKLDASEQNPAADRLISSLENMFKLLADQLDELTLSASEELIRATNNLVMAIKSKLDALVDSEIIRSSFMKIVDKVAGLCLIDARYKSAAILYSQIEDNVNAIKALMRTGEADTVMNYALLVRDITVNRITINYIKHLRLEPEVIENFIRQSKL